MSRRHRLGLRWADECVRGYVGRFFLTDFVFASDERREHMLSDMRFDGADFYTIVRAPYLIFLEWISCPSQRW